MEGWLIKLKRNFTNYNLKVKSFWGIGKTLNPVDEASCE